MTRQRRWQLKMKALGRCRRCGDRREHYDELCDGCRAVATGDEYRRSIRVALRRVRAAGTGGGR